MPTKKTLTRKLILKSYQNLVEKSDIDVDYLFLTAVAAAICALGFEMNSPSVIIGAMIIFPLLYSPLLVGTSIFRKDGRAFIKGLKALLVGIVITITVSVIFNIISPTQYMSEITTRLLSLPFHYFLVAFFTGLAGTFAYFWPEMMDVITGISISVALVPPLVMVGIGIAHSDVRLLLGSAIIVAMNLFGLLLASFVTMSTLFWVAKPNK